MGPLTGDPAIVGVPTFVVGSVMLGLALIIWAPGMTPAATVHTMAAFLISWLITVGLLTLIERAGELRRASFYRPVIALRTCPRL